MRGEHGGCVANEERSNFETRSSRCGGVVARRPSTRYAEFGIHGSWLCDFHDAENIKFWQEQARLELDQAQVDTLDDLLRHFD